MTLSILNYEAELRPLRWKEEVSKPDWIEDYRQYILTAALTEVRHKGTGKSFHPSSLEEAFTIIKMLPESVLGRSFILYKNDVMKDLKFRTVDLYKAPDPKKHMARVQHDEEEIGKVDPEVRPASALSKDAIASAIIRQAEESHA